MKNKPKELDFATNMRIFRRQSLFTPTKRKSESDSPRKKRSRKNKKLKSDLFINTLFNKS